VLEVPLHPGAGKSRRAPARSLLTVFVHDREAPMRMLDAEKKRSVRILQLYLTPDEAREMRDRLDELLADPEATTHFHIPVDSAGWELSCSIVTPRKLQTTRYTQLERKLLEER
jgi:hypothetical protein